MATIILEATSDVQETLQGIGFTQQNLTNPLSSLDTNFYAAGVAQYPRNLGKDLTRQHYVEFFINRINASKIQPSSPTSEMTNKTNAETSEFIDVAVIGKINLSAPTTQLAGTIRLYMPDTVVSNYTNAYQEDDLAEYSIPKFGQAIREFSESEHNSLKSLALDPNVLKIFQGQINNLMPVDVILKSQGLAVNPQVQLLFKATALRSFEMTFLFSPYSQDEARSVRNIINMFKYHAAPEIGPGAQGYSGQFYILPSTFNIKYMFREQENPFLNKIGECVLQDVNVDYAPSGWITFPDGSPVQTRLTLSFKEMTVVDKNKIAQGY